MGLVEFGCRELCFFGMKHTTAAAALMIAWCMGVCGCSSSGSATKDKPADRGAVDLLGPSVAYVLANPTRVEGWNFQRPDGSIATDPGIQPLKASVGKDLARVLLEEETYRLPPRGGGFERAVGFLVWRGDQNAEIYLSFANDQLYLKYPGYAGTPTSRSAGFTNARAELLRVAEAAFPGYKAPDAPKVKKVK